MPSNHLTLRKGEKSLLIACALALCCVGGTLVFFKTRDAEPRWNIPPAASPLPHNGYDDYVAASKATVRFTPEADPASDTTVSLPNSPYALKNYSLPRRLKWLAANKQTFALLNQGLASSCQSPDYASNQDKDWARLRQLARDISARSRTFKMQHQPFQSTQSVLDGMQMGQDISRDGGLLPRLVGIAIVAISRSPLDDWNKTINTLSAAEARTATRRLELLLAHEPTTAQTLEADRRRNLLELKQLFSTPNWRQLFKTQEGLDLEGYPEEVPQLWQRRTIAKQQIYDDVNRAIDIAVANANLPYSQVQKAVPPHLDVFTDVFVGTKTRVTMNDARNATSNNMLLLRLALRAYIADHGQAPPNLAFLVPSYLKSIPTDVYNDSKPLFYTPQGQNYKLWSVGPDGINNGGVPLSRRPDDKGANPVTNLLDNTGDFVAGSCR